MNRLLLPAPATKQEPPTEETAPELVKTRQVPGAPQTTVRAPQTQVPAIPASEHERLKRKRESFRQHSAKRARASRPLPNA